MLKRFLVLTLLLSALILTACGGDGKNSTGIGPDVPGEWNMTRDKVAELLQNQGTAFELEGADSLLVRATMPHLGLKYTFKNNQLESVMLMHEFSAANTNQMLAEAQKWETRLTELFGKPEILVKEADAAYFKVFRDGNRYLDFHALYVEGHGGAIRAIYYSPAAGENIWRHKSTQDGYISQ